MRGKSGQAGQGKRKGGNMARKQKKLTRKQRAQQQQEREDHQRSEHSRFLWMRIELLRAIDYIVDATQRNL